MTTAPEPAPKPKRKRKTKAEREAERQAEAAANAAKPIDPAIWIIVGALILFVAFWTWADPVTFANAGQNPSIFQLIPLVMIRISGKPSPRSSWQCWAASLSCGGSLAGCASGWVDLTPLRR